MSARDEIRRYVSLLGDSWTPRKTTDARVEQVYAAVRAEVLRDVAARFKAACPDSGAEVVFDLCRCDSADILRRMADEAGKDTRKGESTRLALCTCGHSRHDGPCGDPTTACGCQHFEAVGSEDTRTPGESTRAAIVAERDAQIIAWLVKKARECRATRGRKYAEQADVIAQLASKVARGAVRPNNLGLPWQRAVDGLNALVDAGIPVHIDPDGHIANPAGDEHIEWDREARRWRLVHDDEGGDADA
ncbi:hypothetical protein CP973_07085 [Streptomyces albofaciens JCM 4342]|uniref:hypothetical protein n=1 Tax=Streptomyces albofaciens TaxID=66866 RepID=UPI001239CC72|nr:hypothetical protein [Streptomyces albofaciens]KAA6221759.1 hypothetical protein CP973_07085 [Streptomyces albofaciens JCM 4342]